MRSACGLLRRQLIMGDRRTVRDVSKVSRPRFVQGNYSSSPLTSSFSPASSMSHDSFDTLINSRALGTKSSTTTLTSSLSQNEKNYFETLRRKTKEWLEKPIGSWTQKDISQGRFLIREWSDSSVRNHGDDNSYEQAIAQTRIIRRWIKERIAVADRDSSALESLVQSQKQQQRTGNSDSHDMIEMVNRCLDSWRKAAMVPFPAIKTMWVKKSSSSESTPQAESMGLIHLFCDASELLNDAGLYPTRKTYSMCMNVLSLHPESPTACDDVISLLNQCRKTTTTDLQFYNVCLHTLATCAKHHSEAPSLVERIFREMTTNSEFTPNTACFVSVLHAWANSIPGSSETKAPWHHDGPEQSAGAVPLAAERTEAILNQMMRDYPQLVDTICFNICIDAWGKQGYPEKAEAILKRLHQYHQSNSSSQGKTEIRPNQISFNSAIKAWSKSARFGGSGKHDPQKAADRAALLLQQMRVLGLDPTPETFGSILEAYSKTPNPGIRVQSFLGELEKLHAKGNIANPPPKVCYLMAIQAWGRTKPEGAKSAEDLVKRLEKVCLQEGDEWEELQPCTILYTALISAWAQSDIDFAPDRAREIFRDMIKKSKNGRKNLFPNTITRNAVLEAFCNHGRVDEAREFLTKTRRTVSPDSKAYLTILKAYAESNSEDGVEKAEDFLRYLEDSYHYGEHTIRPTIQMYSQVLVALGNSPQIDGAFRAEELFWKLLRQDDDASDVIPDTATFNCVLRAWSKSSEGGAAERAENFLRTVRDEDRKTITIDPISHLHLIYAWAHSRRRNAPREAEKHLEQARALCNSSPCWHLTRAHFNGVILAWKKSNDSNASRRILELQEERDSTTFI